MQGQTRRDEQHRVASGRNMLVQQARFIPEPPGQCVFRDDRKADFVRNEDDRADTFIDGADQRAGPTGDIFLGQQQVGKPEGEAIDQNCAGAVGCANGGGLRQDLPENAAQAGRPATSDLGDGSASGGGQRHRCLRGGCA